ncbi:hypothetical protein IIA16_00440 [bacterium]|nr:hypothetical protein [bacterium]
MKWLPTKKRLSCKTSDEFLVWSSRPWYVSVFWVVAPCTMETMLPMPS